MQRFVLCWSWQMYLSFCLLAYLLGAAHEFAHHFAGYLGSGGFGRITFVLFSSPENDPHPILTSLAGPALTILVAWIGALMLLRPGHQVWGYALIAGSHSYMRLIGVVGRGGDESLAARTLFGYLPYWQLTLAELVLVLPPIVLAYLSLANRRRPSLFAASMFGPFLPLIAIKMLDDRWFVAFVNSPGDFHQPSWIGIPLAVLATDLIALALFLTSGKRILQEASTQSPAQPAIRTASA